ncbi:MAG TPA: pyridoxamine 5'-phosphate oxidase family protein [Bacilli bacterium]
MAEIVAELSDLQLHQLQKEPFVLLGTIDAETSVPVSSAISWVYAPDSRRIRFAIDQRSRLISNIQAAPHVTITFFAGGSVYAASGKAKIAADALEGVPFKLACFEMAVESVKDIMFYGARVSVEPEYEKTYDKRAAEKLDNQVFAAIKKAWFG